MLFPLIALSCSAQVDAAPRIDNFDIDTTSGKVHGVVDKAHPDVAQFLGVPFAEQPVGARRWLPATRKAKEEKTIDATRFGPACSQWDGGEPGIYNTGVTEFLIQPPDNIGEDCLSVSIWTPSTEDSSPGKGAKGLPVIIWIYGGGFVAGGSNVPYQNPAPWVQRSKKHIVVSIQYRLGIFGYPNAQGLPLEEQNLGLLDQHLAVEWIRDNIAKFGGDPARMSLMGQSAGGMSTDYYNFAYPEDPIVKAPCFDVEQNNFTFIANQFGCISLDAKARLECFRQVSAADINAFQKKYLLGGNQLSLNFVPIVDNRTKFDDAEYTARSKAGNFSGKPMLTGTAKNEGAAVVPYNTTNPVPQAEMDEATQSFVLCPTVRTARERYAANATTFRYRYSGNFTNISPQSWFGAYHSSELPLIFGTYDIARGEGTELEEQTSEKMQDAWVAFAEDPLNGLPQIGWNRYDAGKGQAVELNENEKVVQPIAESALEGACNVTAL